MGECLITRRGDGKSEGQYVWKKLTAQGGDFLDYVVSDNETKYPDGAVHTDGYWYERVASNIASGSITPTSNVTSLSIEHNLGANPKILFVFANVLISTDNANKIQTVAITNTETLVAYGSYSGGATSNNATIVNDSTNQLTLSAKNSTGSTPLSFNKNTSYKWIAIG